MRAMGPSVLLNRLENSDQYGLQLNRLTGFDIVFSLIPFSPSGCCTVGRCYC